MKSLKESADPLVHHRSPSLRNVYSWKSLTRKNMCVIQEQAEPAMGLAKCLTAVDLISYGVGSTVGAGIFVTVGIVAAEKAGPGTLLSFLFAAIACLLSAFCYSEFAARIPVSGSAYTFSYAVLGEFIGWLYVSYILLYAPLTVFSIGWNLTLEYTISASAVARGWASYVAALFKTLGVTLPDWLVGYPINKWFNISPLAVVIIVLCSFILIMGVKDSAKFNLVITILNVVTILFVIILGAFYIDVKNWDPFLPFGMSGAFSGAGTVFFSYIGFDSVSSLAGEVKKPTRDLPIGIVGTLLIATVLYVGVSLVITGMVNYATIDHNAPLATAFLDHGLKWAAVIIAVGSVTALTATTLCSLLGQPRIYYQMSKDGLIPPAFGTVHARTQAPIFGTLVTGVLASTLALILDLDTLADMISIGTLLAFTVVCAGVIVLRLDKEGADNLKLDKPNEDKVSLLHSSSKKHKFGVKEIPAPPLLFIFFISAIFFGVIWKESWPYWALAIPGTPMFVIYVLLQVRKQVNLPTSFR